MWPYCPEITSRSVVAWTKAVSTSFPLMTPPPRLSMIRGKGWCTYPRPVKAIDPFATGDSLQDPARLATAATFRSGCTGIDPSV